MQAPHQRIHTIYGMSGKVLRRERTEDIVELDTLDCEPQILAVCQRAVRSSRLTYHEIAGLAGINRSTLVSLLQGHTKTRKKTVVRVLMALGWRLGTREAVRELHEEDDNKPKRIHFESSLCIRPHGGTTVREVKSVNGACEILIDWPHAKRGPYYQSAREVVQAALDGKVTPDQAREAFAALAAHAGILVERSVE